MTNGLFYDKIYIVISNLEITISSRRSLMVEHQLPKLSVRVRFPPLAPCRGTQEAEGTRLESVQIGNTVQGFKSPPLRQIELNSDNALVLSVFYVRFYFGL